jgi:hypothetical protein
MARSVAWDEVSRTDVARAVKVLGNMGFTIEHI